MRRKTLLFFFLLSVLTSRSQNPATIFSIPNRNVVLACGTACTTITATVPHIKQTDDYIVTPMAYLPYAYTTASGVDVATLIAGSLFDDRWTSKVPITFPFCFYGITYPTLVIGTNSAITFDSTQASTYSGYVISNTTGAIPNSAYYGPEIFGPYHDIDIDNPGPNKRIEYRIEGVAPNRRFIVSYSAVPYFSVSCTTSFATHQMVLYESTGVIEVYIQDKPSCTAWNSGLSILGVQNGAENKAVAAPGKNATVWGSTGMNEAYRFTPSGGVPKFKKAELLVNGAVVGTGDTTSGNPGLLNLNFANVCPGSDSTAYILRVTYGTCNNTAQDVSFQDTVFIKRTKATIALSALNASCGTGGTITATATGGTGFQYSLNGGAPQAGNTFSNLNAGIYTVSAQSGTCVSNAQTTIVLNNTLKVDAFPADTALCAGASFTPRVTSAATAYSWTPSSSVTGSTLQQPVLSVNQNTKFIVTATQGQCIAKDTINTTVFTGAVVNAGPDMLIIQGDSAQLQGSSPTPGASYVWTPVQGLNQPSSLRPLASPLQTTTYKVTITTPQGCVATDEAIVTVVPYCVKPMEAFTPNGDGVNDFWQVTNGNCLKSAKAEVYNRYGNKVFESQDYHNDWNGTYKGKALPDGTYYFVITYQLINQKTVYLKGNVTILR